MPSLVTTNHFDQLATDFFKKSHRLVFSQLSLSATEQDILALFLTKLSKEKWESFSDENGVLIPDSVPKYAFTSDVLAKWLGKDKRDLYSTLYKPSLRLVSKVIGIRDDEKGKFKFYNLFPTITYEGGTLTLKPNEDLFKEIFVVSKGHAQVPHKEFRSLESEHSKRLFTIFCRFKAKGELKEQSINDLHALLGLLNPNGELAKSSYEKTSVLLKRVIEPAILEISEKVKGIKFSSCPYDKKRFGYSVVKDNKTIVGVSFRYSWKDEAVQEEKSAELPSPLELAIFTHMNIEMCEFGKVTQEGIDALKAHMTDLMMDGFDCGIEFMQKFKSAVAQLNN